MSTFGMVYTLSRSAVQFLEALSIVRAQRAEDTELLEVCSRGEARGSAKMRAACMPAHADLASPIIFKAIVQAVTTAMADFADAVSSPSRVLYLILFILASVMVPTLPWVRWLSTRDATSDAHTALNGIHYIQYASVSDGDYDEAARRPSIRSRWRGAAQRIGMVGAASGCQLLDSDVEVQLPGFSEASEMSWGKWDSDNNSLEFINSRPQSPRQHAKSQ